MVTMNNITAEIRGDKLVITVDVSPKVKKEAPRSASGKNNVLASTRGFLAVNDISIGLNVLHKPN